MTPGVVRLTMRTPQLAERAWYRRLGIPVPLAVGSSGPWHANWVRLLPYRWRRIHRRYAQAWGFFWLRCPLCDRPFGGHESGATIPDPIEGPGRGITICSRCTREGRGQTL